ncbi:MAG TPA: tetratricopeptide repeat protein [Kofleriaceae bacterium]|nr:tetratricopeptide repeat protein [Kofleriaceae bacterium]
MTRSLRFALACAVLVAAASAPAFGQPTGDKKKALDLYDKGNTQYNLGRWKQAIELFTQAYEAYNAPEFLFNIAQAHRQDGNCSEALFFYRRYLANKPNASNKAEVDGFIKELEGKCTEGTGGGTTGTGTTGTGTTGTGTGTTGTGTTGTGTTGTGTTGTGTATTGTGTGTTGTGTSGTGTTRTADTTTTVTDDDDEVEDDEDGSIDVGETGGRPRLVSANLGVGPSFMTSGDLNKPPHMAFALGAGYPLAIDKASFEPGLLVTYSPVPWEGKVEGMEVTGTAGLTALLANAAGGYPIVPSLPALSARAEIGLGVLVMSGLDRGNPFLEENQFADGSIAMFHARVALGAEYMVTPNLALFAQPVVFSFSPASKLRDEISSVTRYEILFGAGYKM